MLSTSPSLLWSEEFASPAIWKGCHYIQQKPRKRTIPLIQLLGFMKNQPAYGLLLSPHRTVFTQPDTLKWLHSTNTHWNSWFITSEPPNWRQASRWSWCVLSNDVHECTQSRAVLNDWRWLWYFKNMLPHTYTKPKTTLGIPLQLPHTWRPLRTRQPIETLNLDEYKFNKNTG